MADWYDNPPADNGTPGETLWNRPDRGLPPIVQVVDDLLTDADQRLNEVARRLGVGNTEPKANDVRLRKYGGEAA
jgi:hypothetical protein